MGNITSITSSGLYNPPANKNLYITSVTSNITISSNTIFTGTGNVGAFGPVEKHIDLPIIASSNDEVDGSFSGFLIDSNVEPITISLSEYGETYIVPSGKLLVILNAHSYYGGIEIDNQQVLQGYFNYHANITGCSPSCIISPHLRS